MPPTRQLPASMSPLVFVLMATGSSPSAGLACSSCAVGGGSVACGVTSRFRPTCAMHTYKVLSLSSEQQATFTIMYHGRIKSLLAYRHELINGNGLYNILFQTCSYSRNITVIIISQTSKRWSASDQLRLVQRVLFAALYSTLLSNQA